MKEKIIEEIRSLLGELNEAIYEEVEDTKESIAAKKLVNSILINLEEIELIIED